MDKYISARLERAEHYFNAALEHSKCDPQVSSSAGWTHEHVKNSALKAALDQFKRIEKYIHQCGTQAAEDSKYISIIE